MLNKTRFKKKTLLWLAGAVITLDVGAALAADEVVVTARKREENLQEVPISVTAFSGDALEKRGMANLSDLNAGAANLGWQTPPHGGGGGSAFFIRGVGQFDYIATADQSVGLYVDGVYIGRAAGALLNIVDVKRIEILRGPQGTLFGRNTPAGAVQVVTKRPSIEDGFTGYLSATTGSRDRIDVKGAVNMPLGETAALRLSGATLNQDGPGVRLVDGRTDLGNVNDDAVRAQLMWRPAETVDVDISGFWSQRKGNLGLLHVEYINDADPFVNLYNVMLTAQGFPIISSANFVTGDPYDSWKGVENVDDQEVYATSGTITWHLNEALTLKSITAYRTMESLVGDDFDGTPYPFVDQIVRDDTDQFSEELQLQGQFWDNRLQWIGGFYFYKENAGQIVSPHLFEGITSSGPGTYDFVVDPMVFGLPGIAPNLSQVTTIDQETTSYSVFSEATLSLTNKFDITVGGRYTRDKKDIDQGVTGIPTIPLRNANRVFEAFTPRFIFSYHASDDVMVYASASRGFRSGGFNGRETTAVIAYFEPEYLWSYEAGLRSDLFDDRLRFNLTGFYYDYKDRQGTVLRPDQSVTVGNVGAVEMYGFEVETVFLLNDYVRFDGGLGFLKHEVTELNAITGVPGLTLSSKLENAPKLTANAGVQVDVPIGVAGDLWFRADMRYKGAHEFLLPNFPGERQDAYALVDLRMGWTSPNGHFGVDVFGRNVFDEDYSLFRESTAGFGYDMLLAVSGRPAEWGATVTLRF